MGVRILVDPEAMEGYAQKYEGKASDMEQMVKDITNIVENELPNEWQGAMLDAFQEQYKELQPSFSAMVDLIKGIATETRSIADKAVADDEDGAAQIKQMFN